MIAGIFHQGSGVGNQLHRYVATRVLAEDKGYDFGMVAPELFKGKSFMDLKLGLGSHTYSIEPQSGKVIPFSHPYLWEEKKVTENGIDIRSYDPEINWVPDGAIIDGEFQDEKYFKHRLDDVRRWLAVEPLNMPDDLCIIGFRGGEFTVFPDLFLTKEYWVAAIEIMLRANNDMRFEVHTDDPITAQKLFPDFKVIHDVGVNWRSVRYAKHLIISNSSFYILPSLLNEDVEQVVAPRFWARRNIGVWAMPSNHYSDPRWKYI